MTTDYKQMRSVVAGIAAITRRRARCTSSFRRPASAPGRSPVLSPQVRSNLRFAARPGISHGSDGRSWDRYYFYRPELLAKVLEIYRFAHNWLGDRKTKETPAMRLGLAKGKTCERDLVSG